MKSLFASHKSAPKEPAARNHRRYLILGFFLLGFCGVTQAARVAILPSPGLEDAAAVLSSSLSSSPGIEVVEREQIETIFREKNLQIQMLKTDQVSLVGRLVNAQALLILDRPGKGKKFSARLVATEAGIVIAHEIAEWPMEDPAGWSALLARQVAAMVGSLPDKPGATALVALLGVRSPTAGPQARQLERETAFTLASALTGLPGVFALERERMREADWENQLAASATGKFWSGTWLIDGNVQKTPTGLAFDGQMRPVGPGMAQPIKVQASDLGALGKEVSTVVAKALGTAPSVTGETGDEAGLFQEQAEWAFRWKLYEEAERAADASWLLGNKTEAVGLIRSLSPCLTVEEQIPMMGGTFPSSVSFLQGLETLTRGFSNLMETIRHSGRKPSEQFLADTTRMITVASKYLKTSYFKNPNRGPEEDAQLQWLRAQLRLLASVMNEECQRAWMQLDERQKKNAHHPTIPPAVFFAEALTYCPLWGDTPEESAAEFEKALAVTDQLDPPLARGVRRIAILDREQNSPVLPIVVAWNAADRPRVSEVRNQLIDRMDKGTPERRLEACYLGMLRFHHLDEAMQKRVPDDVLETQLGRVFGVLKEICPQITAGQIEGTTLSETISMAVQIAALYKRPGLSALTQKSQKELLLRLLKMGWPGPPEVYNPLLNSVSFTNTERDEFVAAIQAVPRPASGNWISKHFEEQVVKRTNIIPDAKPTPPPIHVASNPLPPTFVFPLDGPGGDAQIESILTFDGRYLVRMGYFSTGSKIIELDPRTGRQKTLLDVSVENDETKFAALQASKDWVADKNHLYFIGNRSVHRFDRTTGRLDARQLPLLSNDRAVVRIVLGQIYLVQSDALIRIDPGSLKAELLASARRRPAQTLLDDQKALTGTPIEDRGKLALVGEQGIYHWIPEQNNFLLEPLRLRPSSGGNYDPALILRLQPQLADVHHPSSNLGYWILLDPARTGRLPSVKGIWPPPLSLEGEGKFPSQIHDLSVGGQVLYVLFSGEAVRSLHLLALSPIGRYCAPLGDNVSLKNKIPFRNIIAIETGALIWDTNAKAVSFYSFKDIEKFRQ